MKGWRGTAAGALALPFLLGGCQDDPRRLEQIFLAGVNGEWTGDVTETSAADQKVVRTTQLRMVIDPADRPLVQFPLIDCAGTLLPASEELPDAVTEDTVRFYQHVPKARGGPCRPGPVRLRRVGDALEYAYLGNNLMQVVGTLERTPGTEEP